MSSERHDTLDVFARALQSPRNKLHPRCEDMLRTLADILTEEDAALPPPHQLLEIIEATSVRRTRERTTWEVRAP